MHRTLLTAALLALALAATAAGPTLAQPSSATLPTAEAGQRVLSATGTFRPPGDVKTAPWPTSVPFTAADLAQGNWSLEIVMDRLAVDRDADPYVGRFDRAVQRARLTLGTAVIAIPAAAMKVVVSDGGQGMPWRESVRIEAALPQAGGQTLLIAWTQLNQQATTQDLRGSAGQLGSDGLPAPAVYAALLAASPFDSFLSLQLNAAQSGSPPLAYLASRTARVDVRDQMVTP